MTTTIEAYPLQWPIGYKRTVRRFNSQFKQSMENAQRFLRAEINRLGANELIISSNIPVRKDGMLYADWMSRRIDDPGVAIYFKYKGESISMCCDQYTSVWENIYALGKGIESLRGMERWGVSDFLNRAFTGFKALPETSKRKWWEVLGIDPPSNPEKIKERYRELVKKAHPDAGGTSEQFHELQEAYTEAIQ